MYFKSTHGKFVSHTYNTHINIKINEKSRPICIFSNINEFFCNFFKKIKRLVQMTLFQIQPSIEIRVFVKFKSCRILNISCNSLIPVFCSSVFMSSQCPKRAVDRDTLNLFTYFEDLNVLNIGKPHHKKKRKSSDNVTRGGGPAPASASDSLGLRS